MVQPNAVARPASTWTDGKRSLRSAPMARPSAMISGWVFRMLLSECGSLTETGMVITWAPASNASVAYLKFGTSTTTRRLGIVSACATTCAQSAIWGSARGETNEPTSISRNPARAIATIQRCLSAVGMILLTLCRPSRGPTSLTKMSIAAPIYFIEHHTASSERIPGRIQRPQPRYGGSDAPAKLLSGRRRRAPARARLRPELAGAPDSHDRAVSGRRRHRRDLPPARRSDHQRDRLVPGYRKTRRRRRQNWG